MEWDSLYKNLKIISWGILLVLTSISYFVMSHTFTFGIVVGGVTAMASFHMLQHTIRKGFTPERILIRKKASIITKFFLRFGAMGALIYMVISRQWVHPVGLTVGLSIVIISIVILGIMSIRRMFLEETT